MILRGSELRSLLQTLARPAIKSFSSISPEQRGFQGESWRTGGRPAGAEKVNCKGRLGEKPCAVATLASTTLENSNPFSRRTNSFDFSRAKRGNLLQRR